MTWYYHALPTGVLVRRRDITYRLLRRLESAGKAGTDRHRTLTRRLMACQFCLLYRG